jgi:hypothetical protein
MIKLLLDLLLIKTILLVNLLDIKLNQLLIMQMMENAILMGNLLAMVLDMALMIL